MNETYGVPRMQSVIGMINREDITFLLEETTAEEKARIEQLRTIMDNWINNYIRSIWWVEDLQ